MKTAILEPLTAIPYFTIESVKQLWPDAGVKDAALRTTLYRWMKRGQIIQLKKGVYMTHRFFELHRADPDFSPAVSAILLTQSYVSLEFVLQRHAVLTEITYPVSCVTSKNTRVIQNTLGTFSYRHIRSDLYRGFSIASYYGILFAQASAAKALFDYLYLRPAHRGLASPGFSLTEDLRLNIEDFSPADREEFTGYIAGSRSPKMDSILNNLRKTVWRT